MRDHFIPADDLRQIDWQINLDKQFEPLGADGHLIDEFVKFRDSHWLSLKKQRGEQVWNGLVYFIPENYFLPDGGLPSQVEVGTIDFRTLSMKLTPQGLKLLRQTGSPRHMSVNCLIFDSQKRLCLGKRKDGMIDNIGGIFSLDELPVQARQLSLLDQVGHMASIEAKEEANLEVPAEQWQLLGASRYDAKLRLEFYLVVQVADDTALQPDMQEIVELIWWQAGDQPPNSCNPSNWWQQLSRIYQQASQILA